MWHNCKHRNFRAFFFYRSNYCNENCWLKCLRGLSLCHSVCVYWMWNGEQSIVCQFLEKRTHETMEKKKFSFVLFSEWLCSCFFVLFPCFFFFFLSFDWSRKINQKHTHNSSPISICQSCSWANGYWAKMRLPFSLTKYMRFSVWFSFSFTRSITVQAISLPLSLSCTCLIFQIFIFILVECSCCPSYSCRCTFLRFVRARHSITCCFVCVLFFRLFSFSFGCFQRASLFSSFLSFYVRSLFASIVYFVSLNCVPPSLSNSVHICVVAMRACIDFLSNPLSSQPPPQQSESIAEYETVDKIAIYQQ